VTYKGLSGWFWIATAGVAAMVVGSFGPWAKAFAFTVSGTDGSNDGWLVVAGAVLAALALWAYSRSTTRWLPIVNVLVGAAGTAITLYDRHEITTADDDAGIFNGVVQVGWGLNLALAGSVAVAVASIALAAAGRVHGDATQSSPAAPHAFGEETVAPERTDS